MKISGFFIFVDAIKVIVDKENYMMTPYIKWHVCRNKIKRQPSFNQKLRTAPNTKRVLSV